MNLQELLTQLDTPIVIRPTRRMTQGELETYLDKAADILRGNADHSEFRGYVFALLFYKRISDCYDEEVRTQTEALVKAGVPRDQALLLARDPQNHHFTVPEQAAWADVARTAKGQLGQALNEAMLSIERANAHRQNNFDGILTGKIDFNKQDELPRDKLVNLINHFSSQTFDRAHVSDDLFGNAYEYLIRNFASKAGKSSGEFYTPAEVGFLMAEVLQPRAGMSVCDWASGSGGLLLQCIRHVKKHGGDVRQLQLHGQESNVTTYNISRINMILHGIPVWEHKQGDSLRDPRHLTAENRLKQFDRIIMNPPFSLEDWGHDTVSAGDKYGRLGFGMPPASNGDWAWLQQIAKSLKDADADTGVGGQGMVVMSQGVLFRGQPEQTEEEDGQNQKADTEYVIRRGFIEADLIEAVVVLPGKLFYGNNVPGCLLLLNKAKPEARKGKILMIWASRHFQKGNPQNLLRPSDLMRVLVPWQAFGDLVAARQLVPVHEALLIREVEQDRDSRLADIEDAYGPVLEPLARLKAELATLEALDLKVQAVRDAITPEHPYFHPLAPLKADVDRIEAEIAAAGRGDKGALKAALLTSKAKFDLARKQLVDAIKAREKQVTRAVKELQKLQEERDAREQEIKLATEREINHLHEAAADMLRIVGSEDEAQRYFTVVGTDEITENEFSLNLPRYVDTFESEPTLPLKTAVSLLAKATSAAEAAQTTLSELLAERSVAASVFESGLQAEVAHKPCRIHRCYTAKIPAHWDDDSLGRSLLLVEYGTNAASNEDRRGYPVIAIPQVVAPHLTLAEVPYAEIPESEAKVLRLEEDDVLLVRTNGNPEYIGKSTIVSREVSAVHTVFASYLIRVRPDKKVLLGAYLNYFLASPLGRRQATAAANTSAGNNNIGARAIRKMRLPRPPIEEQIEIVAMLDSIEKQLDAEKAKLSAAVELKRTLLESLLTGSGRSVQDAVNA